jgi:2-succinyl-6-hydroxy-2,4-cyclohexadiene-1-carboxylate synthase
MAPAVSTGNLSCEVTGSGPRVALLHGANQTARSWQRVSSLLAIDFEVVAVDLPFHGQSQDVAVSDLGELASMLATAVGRATYVGYFVGGRAAIELALIRPELVERLVVFGSVGGVRDDAERARRRLLDIAEAERFEQATPEEARRLLAEDIERRLERDDFFLDPEGLAIERASNHENSPGSQARAIRALSPGVLPARFDRLAELDMPVLCPYGELAPVFGTMAREIAAAVGDNARVAAIPRAGHPSPFEQPEAFVTILRTWMEET